MNEHRRFAGIYPILYAFFDQSGALDKQAMEAQVDACIASGAHGITVLGIVTEVSKLDVNERRALMELVGQAIDGRVPYAVTIAEPSVEGQVAFAENARSAGASWVVLQPPPGGGFGEAELIRFFGAVADRVDLPIGIQNNPINLDSWLSVDGLIDLHRNHPNVTLVKGEGPASGVAKLIQATQGTLDVFCGHGGLELMMNLDSGAAGLIPAPELVDIQVRIYNLYRRGDPSGLAEAHRLHQEVLPLIVFMSRSVPDMLCYGKRLMARRLGLREIHDRPPAPQPDAFVSEWLEKSSSMLIPFGGS
ncbi:MAG: dihydrodipicolinate synthase family protein [Pseudomonadota bacterium]